MNLALMWCPVCRNVIGVPTYLVENAAHWYCPDDETVMVRLTLIGFNAVTGSCTVTARVPE